MKTFAGVDIGGTRVKLGLLHQNELVAKHTFDVKNQESLEANLPLIADQINELAAQSGLEGTIKGVGLAIPSVVDSENLKILSNYVKYSDASSLDLAAWAMQNWQAKLALENDARAALVGECALGAGIGSKYVIMVTIGTGIGSAVMIDGHVIRGKHHLAGNLGGHMSVDYAGPRCNCGDIGCLEAVASSWALPEIIRQHPDIEFSSLRDEPLLDFERLFHHSSNGDLVAGSIVKHCLQVWAIGLKNLVYAFDPEKIILAGGVLAQGRSIINYFQEQIDDAAWLPAGSVEIVAAIAPDWAGVSGAAYLAQSKM
ncbi:MAG: ROK family protein [Saprospiraceae bacterium]